MTIIDIINATGLSQIGFSRDSGIPIRTIEDWISGRRQPPDYLLPLLAEHYGIEKPTR